MNLDTKAIDMIAPLLSNQLVMAKINKAMD